MTRLPVPYWIACLIAASLVGPPVHFAILYLITGSVDQAYGVLSNSIDVATMLGKSIPAADIAFSLALSAMSLFFVFYMLRFIRETLTNSEAELSAVAVTPGAFARVFGPVTSSKWALILPTISLVFGFISGFNLFPGQAFGVVEGIWDAVGSFVGTTFIWTYLRSLVALRRFGKEQLRPLSPFEDRTLGLGRTGSIALALFAAFIVIEGFSVAGILIGFSPILITVPSVMAAVLGALVTFGLAMFVLPLRRYHRLLVIEKRKAVSLANQTFAKALKDGLGDAGVASPQAVAGIQLAGIARDEAYKVRTWPFDTGVLGRLLVILLSVTAILSARLIQLAFGL